MSVRSTSPDALKHAQNAPSGRLAVEHAGLGAPDCAGRCPVFHGHAVDEHAVEGPVARLQRGAPRAGELAERVLQGIVGEVRVEPGEGVPEPPLQNDVTVVVALGEWLS